MNNLEEYLSNQWVNRNLVKELVDETNRVLRNEYDFSLPDKSLYELRLAAGAVKHSEFMRDKKEIVHADEEFLPDLNGFNLYEHIDVARIPYEREISDENFEQLIRAGIREKAASLCQRTKENFEYVRNLHHTRYLGVGMVADNLENIYSVYITVRMKIHKDKLV